MAASYGMLSGGSPSTTQDFSGWMNMFEKEVDNIAKGGGAALEESGVAVPSGGGGLAPYMTYAPDAAMKYGVGSNSGVAAVRDGDGALLRQQQSRSLPTVAAPLAGQYVAVAPGKLVVLPDLVCNSPTETRNGKPEYLNRSRPAVDGFSGKGHSLSFALSGGSNNNSTISPVVSAGGVYPAPASFAYPGFPSESGGKRVDNPLQKITGIKRLSWNDPPAARIVKPQYSLVKNSLSDELYERVSSKYVTPPDVINDVESVYSESTSMVSANNQQQNIIDTEKAGASAATHHLYHPVHPSLLSTNSFSNSSPTNYNNNRGSSSTPTPIAAAQKKQHPENSSGNKQQTLNLKAPPFRSYYSPTQNKEVFKNFKDPSIEEAAIPDVSLSKNFSAVTNNRILHNHNKHNDENIKPYNNTTRDNTPPITHKHIQTLSSSTQLPSNNNPHDNKNDNVIVLAKKPDNIAPLAEQKHFYSNPFPRTDDSNNNVDPSLKYFPYSNPIMKASGMELRPADPLADPERHIRELKIHIHTLTLETQKLQKNYKEAVKYNLDSANQIRDLTTKLNELQNEKDNLLHELGEKDGQMVMLQQDVDAWKSVMREVGSPLPTMYRLQPLPEEMEKRSAKAIENGGEKKQQRSAVLALPDGDGEYEATPGIKEKGGRKKLVTTRTMQKKGDKNDGGGETSVGRNNKTEVTGVSLPDKGGYVSQEHVLHRRPKMELKDAGNPRIANAMDQLLDLLKRARISEKTFAEIFDGKPVEKSYETNPIDDKWIAGPMLSQYYPQYVSNAMSPVANVSSTVVTSKPKMAEAHFVSRIPLHPGRSQGSRGEKSPRTVGENNLAAAVEGDNAAKHNNNNKGADSGSFGFDDFSDAMEGSSGFGVKFGKGKEQKYGTEGTDGGKKKKDAGLNGSGGGNNNNTADEFGDMFSGNDDGNFGKLGDSDENPFTFEGDFSFSDDGAVKTNTDGSSTQKKNNFANGDFNPENNASGWTDVTPGGQSVGVMISKLDGSTPENTMLSANLAENEVASLPLGGGKKHRIRSKKGPSSKGGEGNNDGSKKGGIGSVHRSSMKSGMTGGLSQQQMTNGGGVGVDESTPPPPAAVAGSGVKSSKSKSQTSLHSKGTDSETASKQNAANSSGNPPPAAINMSKAPGDTTESSVVTETSEDDEYTETQSEEETEETESDEEEESDSEEATDSDDEEEEDTEETSSGNT